MLYWLCRFCAFLIRVLPLNFVYWIGLRVSDISYVLNPGGRAAVRENLQIIFEGQGFKPSERTLKGYTRKTFQYFGKYIVDFFRYHHLDAAASMNELTIKGLRHLEELRNRDRGVILLTAHLGNWELGGAFLAALGLPMTVVALPSKSPTMERLYRQQREHRGMKVIELGHAGIATIKALKRKEFVALLGDRDFTANGRRVPFFGREATLPRGPAWLAKRTNAILVMGFVTRGTDDSFFLHIHPPIDPLEEPSEEAIHDKVITILEEEIARNPCQWFLFTPFWPPATETPSTLNPTT